MLYARFCNLSPVKYLSVPNSLLASLYEWTAFDLRVTNDSALGLFVRSILKEYQRISVNDVL